MSAASPAALDDFLAHYTGQVGGGFTTLAPKVQATFAILAVISMTVSGLLWAIDEHQNVPAALIRKVMLLGFFAWLISGWHALSLTVVNGFAALGLEAGGGSMSVGDLMHSPSKIIIDGLQVAFALARYMGRLASEGMGTGFFTHIDAILITALAAIGIILAFAALGIHLMVTIIEFYIVTLIGFVTVPFGILTQTVFLSERAIGYVIAIGVKVMAIAIVVSIGETIFTSYTVSAEPTWGESCGLLIAALAFCMLGFRIPSIAAAQITGGPQLSAGAAASAAVGVAATIGGVALAGRMAAAGLAGAGGKAASAGAAGAARLPPSVGGSSSGGTPGGMPPSPGGGSSSGAGPKPGSGGETAGVGARPAGLESLVEQARGSYAPPETEPQGEPAKFAPDAPAPSASPGRRAKGSGPRRWTRGAAAAQAVRGGETDSAANAAMPRVHPPSDDEA